MMLFIHDNYFNIAFALLVVLALMMIYCMLEDKKEVDALKAELEQYRTAEIIRRKQAEAQSLYDHHHNPYYEQ